MKLLVIKAKVLITSEEQMELRAEHDFGTIQDNDRRWVYRRTAIICSEVNNVIEYSKNKTLVRMWDGNEYLVDEPFDIVKEKWVECKEEEDDGDNDQTPQYHDNDDEEGDDE